jgi:hypothetical protein
MATGSEVLAFLIPQGGWVISENDFDSIQFLECQPITKQEFEAGFALADAAFAKIEADKEKAKKEAQAKLAALGLTLDDLKAIGL